MNITEKFVGTVPQILRRSQNILLHLKLIFPLSSFSILIEDVERTQVRYFYDNQLFDENGDFIPLFSSFEYETDIRSN